VTFKDLKKRVSLETTTHQQSKLFEILQDKPVWIGILKKIDNKKKPLEDSIVASATTVINHVVRPQT
jgi:hypothetical protein